METFVFLIFCDYKEESGFLDDGDNTGKHFFSSFGDGYGLGNGDGFLFVV